VYQLTPSTPIPAQKAVLTVTGNKKQLIKLICEDLQSDEDFVQNHTQMHTLLITGQEETIEIGKALSKKDKICTPVTRKLTTL